MAQQVVGVGTVANDGTGDFLRPAMIKINENFSDLYTRTIDLESTDFGPQPSFSEIIQGTANRSAANPATARAARDFKDLSISSITATFNYLTMQNALITTTFNFVLEFTAIASDDYQGLDGYIVVLNENGGVKEITLTTSGSGLADVILENGLTSPVMTDVDEGSRTYFYWWADDEGGVHLSLTDSEGIIELLDEDITNAITTSISEGGADVVLLANALSDVKEFAEDASILVELERHEDLDTGLRSAYMGSMSDGNVNPGELFYRDELGNLTGIYNSIFDDWVAATSGSPALLVGGEDIDNGVNTGTLKWPDSLSGSVVWEFPITSGTVALIGAALEEWSPAESGSASALEFFEDTDNGVSKTTLKGQANQSSDIVVVLPSTAGTLALSGESLDEWNPASAAGPSSLDFFEDTDNGTSKITVIGQSSLASDIVLTLPGTTGTLALNGEALIEWTEASAAGPSSLNFFEDTDNGVNKINVIGQSTLGGDFVLTLPGVTGTFYVTGGDQVAIADGGTAATTEGDARINLGLEIGVDVQAFDADLSSLATSWTAASGSTASSLDFFEDTDNGTNRARLIGPTSTADVTITLPATTGTVLIDTNIGVSVQAFSADLTSLATNWVQASASGPSSLDFHEDTDTGAHKATVIAQSSMAADIVITLPAATGTILTDADLGVTVQDFSSDLSALDNNWTQANASSASSLMFHEDTDNGSNAVTLIGPASTADVIVTLPSATGTLITSTQADAAYQPLTADLTSLAANWFQATAAGASSLAFHEDTDNGTNTATLVGPASTANVIITLPATTGTVALTHASITSLETQWTPASAAGSASLAFLEDTDNGSSKIVLSGQASLSSDLAISLPAASGTLVNGTGTASTIWAGTSVTDTPTIAGLTTALVYSTITPDGSENCALNGTLGFNFESSIDDDADLNSITNLIEGYVYIWKVTADATPRAVNSTGGTKVNFGAGVTIAASKVGFFAITLEDSAEYVIYLGQQD